MGSGGQKRVALDGNKERFLQKKNFWFLKMDGFWNKQGTAFAKESFLYVKRRFLRTVKSGSNKRCFGYENKRLLRVKHKAFCKRKTFGLRKRQTFSAHTKQPDKEKLFLSAPQQPLRTVPKLTSNCKFYPRQPTVSLQDKNSFSKNISLAVAVQLPFRTDSKPLRRRFAGKTGFGTSRRKLLQTHFRQSFESSPESRGSQTSGVLVGSFCTTQKE